MKNRIAYMPLASIPLETRFIAKNIMVLFDESQAPNTVIKRIAIINEQQNKGLIIDDFQQIGIIDVANKQDGYGNVMWFPTAKIGLLRKLSIERLLESGIVTDPTLRQAVSVISIAEKSNDNTGINAADVFLLAKNYIERYPLPGGA